ncbi:MAG TPA: DUF6308 family protein, partial [Gaiellaceae bacterium]|nr:DUF6308 family protein [Gaiellaceae bacterium]
MTAVALRKGVQVEDPLGVVLDVLDRWRLDLDFASDPSSFGEPDLRRANRDGARISAAQIAAILERRPKIERALRAIPSDASLAAANVPWSQLGRLFDGFAGVHGVGLSKTTKALYRKRPALIPILDSLVHAYLEEDDPGPKAPFGERALALVRGYKRDLDRNRAALRAVERELARRGHNLTEVRILDLL